MERVFWKYVAQKRIEGQQIDIIKASLQNHWRDENGEIEQHFNKKLLLRVFV
jgi:hypothetical protein